METTATGMRPAPLPAGRPAHARAAAGPRRYLAYEERTPVARGLNHQRRNLECLLAEAHRLGRLALLPPLMLAPEHNFGVPIELRWERYFDLDASRIVEPRGRRLPLPLARALPAGPLDRAAVGPRQPVAPAASRCGVLVRRIESEVFSRDVPPEAGKAVVELLPSARVKALAAGACAALAERSPQGFAAAHLRRGDRLFGPMRWLTAPRAVRRALRRLGVGDGATVFFLSDERSEAYWRPLLAAYDAVRSADMPELAALAAGDARQTPDNYLLYEVEKAVMRRAAVRLETFPGGEYEPADAALVPPTVWRAARRSRRMAHAAIRFARRTVGERAWGVISSARRSGRRAGAGCAAPGQSP